MNRSQFCSNIGEEGLALVFRESVSFDSIRVGYDAPIGFFELHI
jgi:hypothetical protein